MATATYRSDTASGPAAAPAKDGDAILTGTALKEAVALGAKLTQTPVQVVNGNNPMPFIMLPEGVKVMALDALVPKAPARVEQSVAMDNVASFCEYLNTFKTDKTRVWGRNGRFIAIIDYHGPQAGEQAWCKHVVNLTLQPTEAFKAWDAIDGKELPQMEFAQFVEDHMQDITNPEGAKMLEVAKAIEGKTDVNFTGKVNLSTDGVVLAYMEETTANGGFLTIPEFIDLSLIPYCGFEYRRFRCRFRYRVNKPRLVLGVKILSKEAVLQAMFDDVASHIASETGVAIYGGMPS